MKIRAGIVCGIAGVVCFVFAMLAFGGAAQTQPAVAKQARDESPLAQTYIVLDRHVSAWLPAVGRLSQGLAAACFAEVYPAIEADPDIGLHLLWTDSRGILAVLARISYWGAPILLLLALVLHFMRPKTVHLIKS